MEAPKLRHLNLEANQLIELPQRCPFLTGLTYLNLSHNRLDALPSVLGEATALVDLSLHHQVLFEGFGEGVALDLQGVEMLTGLERLQRVTLWGQCQSGSKGTLNRAERMAVRLLKQRKIVVE